MSDSTLAYRWEIQDTQMTEVIFVSSIDGRQPERVRKVSQGLKEKRPELTVTILDVNDHRNILDKFNLKYGPCVLIDNRLAFVGIPRLKALLDRLDLTGSGVKVTPAMEIRGWK